MNDQPEAPVPGKASAAQSEVLLRTLEDGVHRRVPLPEVFRALADDVSDKRLQALARLLTARLEAGDDLTTALESTQQAIPKHLRVALRMSAESGNLAAVLRGLSESEIARREMRRALWSILTYPLIVLTLLGLLLIYVVTILRPMFRELYDDFNLDLPTVTAFYMDLAKIFPGIIFTLCLVGLFVAVLLMINSRIFHWLGTCIPLLGRALMWSGQHEFASMMATLTAERMPIEEALDCTVKSLRDRNVARAARIAQRKCSAGKQLSQSLSESIHFDRTLTSLVAWGETHNKLPLALREAAATYLAQMSLYLHFLERVVPPVMLILVATVLVFTVAAFMLPMVELINGLTG